MSVNLWPVHFNPVGGYLASNNREEYHDDIGVTVAGVFEYPLDYVPVGAFRLEIDHISIYEGAGADEFVLDREGKKITLNKDWGDGKELHAYYEREV